MSFVLIQIFNGVTFGMLIFLLATGLTLTFIDENLREYLSRSQPIPIDFLSPVNKLSADPVFSMIEYSCPDCGTLLSVDILPKDELEIIRPEFLLAPEE